MAYRKTLSRKPAQYWLDNLNSEMVHAIASVEGIVLELYYDSVGVATWSVGITSASGHSVERYRRKPSTVERALEVYIWLLKTRYGPRVVRAFKDTMLTEAQFTAALSFDWNTGGIHRASWVKHFIEGNTAAARSSIMNWKTPPSIIGRRKHEQTMFFENMLPITTTMTRYDVTSSLRPKWSSARRIDVSREITNILRKMRTPEDIARDAAASGRTSTTKRATEIGGIGTAVIAAEESLKPVERVGEKVSEITGLDLTLVVAVVVLLALAWVYRERIRKFFEGKRATEMIDITSETPAVPVEELTPAVPTDQEELDAIALQSALATK
jgi:lysozyme